MAILISKSPEETIALGERWGRVAQPGWVIGLSGDLGAGKTQFVKGLARGLGSPARVHSPTFALLNEYAGGRLALVHLDLYRLNGRSDVSNAGLEEYLIQPSGVTVVEWIDRWESKFERPTSNVLHHAGGTRLIQFESISETERRITYEDIGA